MPKKTPIKLANYRVAEEPLTVAQVRLPAAMLRDVDHLAVDLNLTRSALLARMVTVALRHRAEVMR